MCDKCRANLHDPDRILSITDDTVLRYLLNILVDPMMDVRRAMDLAFKAEGTVVHPAAFALTIGMLYKMAVDAMVMSGELTQAQADTYHSTIPTLSRTLLKKADEAVSSIKVVPVAWKDIPDELRKEIQEILSDAGIGPRPPTDKLN